MNHRKFSAAMIAAALWPRHEEKFDAKMGAKAARRPP